MCVVAGRLVVRASVTAPIEAGTASLQLRTVARELKTGGSRDALRLEKGRAQTLDIPIDVAAAGEYRVDFEVEGKVPGFARAGARERRYVVWDGQQPPRLLTGRELRREKRAEVDRALQARLRKDADARASIDDYLRQPLQKLDKVPRIDENTAQALVSPAAGMEPRLRAGGQG